MERLKLPLSPGEMMPRFHFHVWTNGTLVKDTIGLQCDSRREACSHALESMPGLLSDGLRERHDTYVSTEVRNDQDRIVAVVRGTVVLEERPLDDAG